MCVAVDQRPDVAERHGRHQGGRVALLGQVVHHPVAAARPPDREQRRRGVQRVDVGNGLPVAVREDPPNVGGQYRQTQMVSTAKYRRSIQPNK